jgi:hypothetical protein
MNNHVGLAIGGLVFLSGAAMYTAAKPAQPVTTPAPFSERFPPTEQPPHILKKQDRLIPIKTVAVAAVDIVDAGQVNTVDLMAPAEPALTSAQADPAPAPRRHRHVEQVVERNICTRHHMHKVITRGGKSWRCRR